MSTRGKPQPELSETMLGYIRRIGLPLSLISIGLALMTGAPSSWFLTGAFAFYVGALLFAADVGRERFFQSLPTLLQRGIGVAYIVLTGVLTWIWIFAPAPLVVTSEARNPNYPSDAIVGGIKWEPRFSKLRLHVRNETAHDYSKLLVRVETDLGIEQLRPQQDWLNCLSFPDTPPAVSGLRVTRHWRDAQGNWHEQEGTEVASPNKPAFAYRVVCDKLPHDTELDLVGALSNQNLHATIGSPLYLPSQTARWVKMRANYDFRYSHKLERTDCFSGLLGRSMSVQDCGDSLVKPSIFRTDPYAAIKRLQQQQEASMWS